jgi:hypothetical protein
MTYANPRISSFSHPTKISDRAFWNGKSISYEYSITSLTIPPIVSSPPLMLMQP